MNKVYYIKALGLEVRLTKNQLFDLYTLFTPEEDHDPEGFEVWLDAALGCGEVLEKSANQHWLESHQRWVSIPTNDE